eukprot:616031_1
MTAPTPDESTKRIVPVLACVLKQLCNRNDKATLDPMSVTKFHALRPPAISIQDYLERIAKYAACSSECFVLALIYVDRIIQGNHYFVVNSLNVHRLLITSIMLAAKFFDDQYFNNAYYGKVGGVPCKEINSLEIEFLFMVNFNLFVTSEQYKQYHRELGHHAFNACNSCQEPSPERTGARLAISPTASPSPTHMDTVYHSSQPSLAQPTAHHHTSAAAPGNVLSGTAHSATGPGPTSHTHAAARMGVVQHKRAVSEPPRRPAYGPLTSGAGAYRHADPHYQAPLYDVVPVTHAPAPHAAAVGSGHVRASAGATGPRSQSGGSVSSEEKAATSDEKTNILHVAPQSSVSRHAAYGHPIYNPPPRYEAFYSS